VAGLVGESAALWGLTLACFGIGALVAQIAPDFRAAAGSGAAVLVVLFVIDSIGRTSVNRSPLTDLSVFFLYNRSNAFAPGGMFDPVATLALVVIAGITGAIAAVAFTRRDIGSGLIRFRPTRQAPVYEAARNPLLRIPVLRGLWTRRIGTVLWIVGVAAGALAVGDIINLTEFLYDAGANSVDYVTAGADRINRFGQGFTQPYVQSGTYLKLRELNLSFNLPDRLVSGLFGRNIRTARLSVTGRNLLRFTPYKGLDPEVSNFGAQAIVRNIDVAPFPPSRDFYFSIDLGF